MYIFPPSLESKFSTYTQPNFSTNVYQSTLPQLGTTLCIYFPPPLNQNCDIIPCPSLVILCTNLPFPTRYYIMYIFPPPIEPNLCTYTLANFSNIVYQIILPQRGTTLCSYYPPPIEPNLCTYSLPTLVILCTNLPYPNEVLHYVHISQLQLNPNCVILPCPTLLILCTN